MKLPTLALACLAAFSAPASAHWQATRWGMTPDQVRTATSGAIQPVAGATSGPAESKGPFRSGRYEFEALLSFGEDGLNRVHLALRGEKDCRGLREDLQGKYGVPYTVENKMGVVDIIWMDKPGGNRVRYGSFSADYCFVDYFPLQSPSAARL